MITAFDFIRWMRWAEQAADEDEKQKRLARVQKHVFPPGLSEGETRLRKETVRFVETMGDPPAWLTEPTPPPDEPVASTVPAPVLPPPEPPRERWQGFIPSTSRAYHRASIHDGTGAEVARLRDFGRGSPFEAVPGEPQPPARGRAGRRG